MTMHAVGSAIPHPLKVEHDTLFYRLDRASTLPGPIGQAVRALLDALQPHQVAEETYALPPLAVLQALSESEIPAEASAVIMMVERLRQELPTMHQEHRAIAALLQNLVTAAREEQNDEIEALSDMVTLHIEMEERILYPAALLVGELLRLKLRR